MASLDGVRTRHYLAKGVIGQVLVDGCVGLRLRYIGTGSVTSVTVTTATDITMVTTDGGTDAYTWVDYGTLGELAAAINKDGIFEARILDGLSTTVLASGTCIDGAITADALGQYDMKMNTTNAIYLAYRLTYDRTFGTNPKERNMHRVAIQEIVTNLTCGGGADANAFKIYECFQNGNSAPYAGAEELIYQKTPTSGTTSTTNWASGQGMITGGEGSELLLMITDGTSFAATDNITVAGIVE